MDINIVLAIVVAVVLLAVVGWVLWQMRTRQVIKERFGPEYERAVKEYGDESKAVSELGKRQQRISKYHIRALTNREREEFESRWRETQARFVDNPRDAVREADELVSRLMETRGYPMSDFDRRAEDVSVDHPHVVQNYRAAHNIAVADASGKSSTEDMRRALVCYRALFDELLETQPTPTGHEAHA